MAQRNGHRLIVVEMYGDDDLWNQAGQLLDWGGFSHYPLVNYRKRGAIRLTSERSTIQQYCRIDDHSS